MENTTVPDGLGPRRAYDAYEYVLPVPSDGPPPQRTPSPALEREHNSMVPGISAIAMGQISIQQSNPPPPLLSPGIQHPPLVRPSSVVNLRRQSFLHVSIDPPEQKKRTPVRKLTESILRIFSPRGETEESKEAKPFVKSKTPRMTPRRQKTIAEQRRDIIDAYQTTWDQILKGDVTSKGKKTPTLQGPKTPTPQGGKTPQGQQTPHGSKKVYLQSLMFQAKKAHEKANEDMGNLKPECTLGFYYSLNVIHDYYFDCLVNFVRLLNPFIKGSEADRIFAKESVNSWLDALENERVRLNHLLASLKIEEARRKDEQHEADNRDKERLEKIIGAVKHLFSSPQPQSMEMDPEISHAMNKFTVPY